MQASNTSVQPICDQFQSVHLSIYFKNKETDFSKSLAEAFKSLEKKHPKRIAGVNVANARLIEDPLLPMLTVQDVKSGEIVAQVLNVGDYFANKQAITTENAEKLLKIKGVIELGAASKSFEIKKDQAEFELSVGSSYLQNQLNVEELQALNEFIKEKERIIEYKLDAATVSYKDVLIATYRGVEDPFDSELTDLSYLQNPIDPSQVVRETVFKNSAQSDGQVGHN